MSRGLVFLDFLEGQVFHSFELDPIYPGMSTLFFEPRRPGKGIFPSHAVPAVSQGVPEPLPDPERQVGSRGSRGTCKTIKCLSPMLGHGWMDE